MSEKRARKAKKPVEAVAIQEPAEAAPIENHARTHAFKFGKGRYAACECGVEEDLVVRDGKVTRLYRAAGGEWSDGAAMCPKCAPSEPEGPFDWRPNVPIGEDYYAAVDTTAPTYASAGMSEPRDIGEVLLSALREQNPEAFEPEIVDGHDVEEVAAEVMLDVACSPVLPYRAPRDSLSGFGDTRYPVAVTPLDGGMYRVYCANGARDVGADSLKIMRARFLLRRAALARALPDMDPDLRERWMKLYNIGWMPPPDSPLGRQVQTGEVITIKREGDKPVDIAAVFRMLSASGGTIPEVCPVIEEQAP